MNKTTYYNAPCSDLDRHRVVVINQAGNGFSIHRVFEDTSTGLPFNSSEMERMCQNGLAERITRYQAETLVGRAAIRRFRKQLPA